MPLISIIIPTYNRAHLISETLDSIIAQTYSCWECIIVDDGSTDNTKQIVKNYSIKDSRIKYCTRPSNREKGGNTCRNYGLELSRGEYVQWFDSDDLMPNDLLNSKIDVFLQFKDIDFVVSGIITKNENGFCKTFEAVKVDNYLLAYLNDKIILNTFNILWKKAAVLDVKWDETIFKYQDLDFIFRALYNSRLNGSVVKNCFIIVKLHSKRISNNNSRKNNISRLRVRERNYLLSKSTMKEKMQLRLYHLYLFEFRTILSLKDYKLCLEAITSGKVITNFWVKLNLLSYLFLHAITNRGLIRLTKYLIKIST